MGSYSLFCTASIFGCSVFSQWRMWLHFLCLFLLNVHKPESQTFSLHKASSSCLVLHVTKFTPGNISNSWKTEGREKLPKRIPALWVRSETQHLQQNKTERVWPTTTPPVMKLTKELLLPLQKCSFFVLFGSFWTHERFDNKSRTLHVQLHVVWDLISFSWSKPCCCVRVWPVFHRHGKIFWVVVKGCARQLCSL